MNATTRAEMTTRDIVLMLLDDEELARATTSENKPRLLDGDEYVELDHLDRGVRRAHGSRTPMHRVIPRWSVHPTTWDLILSKLSSTKVRGGAKRATP